MYPWATSFRIKDTFPLRSSKTIPLSRAFHFAFNLTFIELTKWSIFLNSLPVFMLVSPTRIRWVWQMRKTEAERKCAARIKRRQRVAELTWSHYWLCKKVILCCPIPWWVKMTRKTCWQTWTVILIKMADNCAIQIIQFNEAEENCSFRMRLIRRLNIGLQARKESKSCASSRIKESLIFQSDSAI